MVPNVCRSRQSPSASKPFDELVKYIGEENDKDPPERVSELFSDIITYAINSTEKLSGGEKCVAIKTNLIRDIKTASIEMNAVAAKNLRCKSPAYHFVLSWPEHERPSYDAIFDAAEHAIKSLGMGQHQYVLAIHADTDNLHCHIAVNRVNPVTYKSKHIEWAHKSLHLAARQSELKHGWTHDNGIYIVEVDEQGKKRIVFNPDHSIAQEQATPYAHQDDLEKESRRLEKESKVATWHDPESLEWWLKKHIARDLKADLSYIMNWQGLHAWLSNYDIKLSDSGGGGLRLRAMSPETGEEFDIAASKGLRLLKRAELEKRWGKFAKPHQVDVLVPDFTHINPIDLQEGIEHVLRNTLDEGSPPDHILHPEFYPDRDEATGSSRLHELPFGSLDVDRSNGSMLLPYPLQKYVGDGQAGHDQDLRRAGPVEKISRGTESDEGNARSGRRIRDNSKREERKAQRAAARADLRLRFSQYKKLVALDDSGEEGYLAKLKQLRTEKSAALKDIRERTRATKIAARKSIAAGSERLRRIVEIDVLEMHLTLQSQSDFKTKYQALQANRQPPLTWREWLYEQSKLGDQAALSALRGIVYQAQRDAARLKKESSEEEIETKAEEKFPAGQEDDFEQVMKRLLEEEKKEIAIRAAQKNMARPYEVYALLKRYTGVQWFITGNGNVKYSDHVGKHLFTDRGNRVTFDRVFVTDDEICLALVHAQQKFGRQLTLTGDDPIFLNRMARIADDMGITILNPELQAVIAQHRIDRSLQNAPNQTGAIKRQGEASHVATEKTISESNQESSLPLEVLESNTRLTQESFESELPVQEITVQDRLRAMVLSIDPQAKFVMPEPSESKQAFHGIVAASLENGQAFAQHIGRGVYALHLCSVPIDHNNVAVEIKYVAGNLVTKQVASRKSRGK